MKSVLKSVWFVPAFHRLQNKHLYDAVQQQFHYSMAINRVNVQYQIKPFNLFNLPTLQRQMTNTLIFVHTLNPVCTFTAAQLRYKSVAFRLATVLPQLNLIISMPFLRQLLGGEMLGLYWVALFAPGLWPFLTVWVRATGQLPCSVCLVFMCLQ